MVVDTEDMTFEAVQGPPRTDGPGADIKIVAQAFSMGAGALLTGFISPYIARTLEKNGMEVIALVSKKVREAFQWPRTSFVPRKR